MSNKQKLFGFRIIVALWILYGGIAQIGGSPSVHMGIINWMLICSVLFVGGRIDKGLEGACIGAGSDLETQLVNVTTELAEADRRAGSAERRMADLEDTILKANRSRDRMKEDAGYHANTSFDVVWSETLEKVKKSEIPL